MQFRRRHVVRFVLLSELRLNYFWLCFDFTKNDTLPRLLIFVTLTAVSVNVNVASAQVAKPRTGHSRCDLRVETGSLVQQLGGLQVPRACIRDPVQKYREPAFRFHVPHP